MPHVFFAMFGACASRTGKKVVIVGSLDKKVYFGGDKIGDADSAVTGPAGLAALEERMPGCARLNRSCCEFHPK